MIVKISPLPALDNPTMNKIALDIRDACLRHYDIMEIKKSRSDYCAFYFVPNVIVSLRRLEIIVRSFKNANTSVKTFKSTDDIKKITDFILEQIDRNC